MNLSRTHKTALLYLFRYIDYMLLMTYNYHGSGWEKETGHHSPLWPHKLDPPGEQRELHQVTLLLDTSPGYDVMGLAHLSKYMKEPMRFGIWV